jgi:DNA modification methylase
MLNPRKHTRDAMTLSVQNRSIASLQLDPRHARIHKPRQITQIAKSIETFGFNVPILTDHTGKVIAGHGRVLACKKLGWETIPTIELAHLTPDQAKAFAIADNRLTEISTWDEALLAQSLQELAAAELNFDIEATGFTMGEIDLRIEGSLSPTDDKADPADQLPVVEDSPVTELGDIWQLGRHRLICANSLDPQTYAPLLEGQRAQMVFTDPPYNVPIHGHVSGKGAIQHREFAMGVGELSATEFITFLKEVFGLLVQHTDTGSIHFICMDWRHSHEMTVAGNASYTDLKNICVWVKDNGGMGSLYRSRHEFVFVFKSGTAPHRNNVQLGSYGRYRTNVWEYPGIHTMNRQSEEGNLLALHPTVKPVQMVADAILDCSARGDRVLDPFLGSGTTLLAAERVGRSCYGIELDPRYVDVAIRRWQQHTGEDAIHVTSGMTFQARLAKKQNSPPLSTSMEASHV